MLPESHDLKLRVPHTKKTIMVAFVAIVAGTVTMATFLCAQSPSTWVAPRVSMPDESVGIDGVVRTLISAFDQADVVALGETHGRF